MVVVDFSKLPASSGGAGGSLSIAGTVGTGGNPLTVSFMQQMLEASAKVSLTLGSNVIVSGTMAVSSQTVSGGLTLSNGQTLDGPMQQDGMTPTGPVLTIGGSGAYGGIRRDWN